jgi:hypothetical protein
MSGVCFVLPLLLPVLLPVLPPPPSSLLLPCMDACRYEGEVANGVRSGRGKLTSSLGAVYDGAWENDLRHGDGTQSWPNGDCYSGAWVQGERCGEGELKSGNGDVFTGEWRANQRVRGRCVYRHSSSLLWSSSQARFSVYPGLRAWNWLRLLLRCSRSVWGDHATASSA